MDRALYEQTRARDACLTGRREYAGDRALYRIVHHGIVEHDGRGLAAKFQRDALQALGGALVNPLS